MPDYQIADRKDSRALAEFLQKEGQFLLPMVSLLETAQTAIDEVIDVAGRATIEAVLQLSAQEMAGPKHPGQVQGAIRWHGRQSGVVPLAHRKLRVAKPRLRDKDQGEVAVPAYQALQSNSTLPAKMLDILLRGVSTRNYEPVLPAMAQTVGVSKSSVSREAIAASEEVLKELAERRFDDRDILLIYLDGLRFGPHHVLAAVGVDSQEISRFWGCGREPARTRWWSRICWKTWSRAASGRVAGGCSSSMAARLCGRGSRPSMARTTRCSAVAGTRSGMCWATCPRTSKRACGRC